MSIETLKVLLIVVSGVCWTIVYLDGIRIGFRDQSYAIPFYALALNLAWEALYTYHGFRINGIDAQNVFNAIWLTFDLGILYTYFRFGLRYFRGYPPATAGGTDKNFRDYPPATAGRTDKNLRDYPPATAGGTDKNLRDYPPATAGGTDKNLRDYPPATAGGTDKNFLDYLPATAGRTDLDFLGWSVLGLIAAFAIQYAFLREFGVAKGAAYSAFPQNLIMSILFIAMLAKRGSREGQSLVIAVSKWIGTLAPTVLYGAIGQGGFPRGSFLILTVGLLCSLFDVIYIWLLAKAKTAQASR